VHIGACKIVGQLVVVRAARRPLIKTPELPSNDTCVAELKVDAAVLAAVVDDIEPFSIPPAAVWRQ